MPDRADRAKEKEEKLIDGQGGDSRLPMEGLSDRPIGVLIE